MNLVFMGTSHFAATILRALAADERFTLQAVYARPARPAGRGQRRERPSAVALLAQELRLDVLRTPENLAGEAAFLRSLQPEAGVVADYGRLLPPDILSLPRHGFVNAHPSLLPRWRGATPVERAIMAGDSHTGVCIMRMVAALDAGDVFACERTAIDATETAGELRLRLADIAAAAMIRTLQALRDGRARATPQAATGVCHAPKLKTAEARLDWRLPARQLERRIRACTPSPGAWFEAPSRAGRTRIGISRARAMPHEVAAAPGTVLDATPLVACGEGALQLLQLQRQGRKSMTASAFLRGFSMPPGLCLPGPQTETPPCPATG